MDGKKMLFLCVWASLQVCYAGANGHTFNSKNPSKEQNRGRIYTDLCSSIENCFLVGVDRLELDKYLDISELSTKSATFCFNGYGIWAIFAPVYLDPTLYKTNQQSMGRDKSEYSLEYFKGETASHARQKSNSILSIFYREFYSSEKDHTEMLFDSYNPSCLLVSTDNNIHVHFRGVGFLYMLINIVFLLVGFVLLCAADSLSKSPLKISLLVAVPVWLVSPVILRLAYMCISMLFGRAYINRVYPVTLQRTIDLICWFLRVLALVTMYRSFQTGDILVRLVITSVIVLLYIFFLYNVNAGSKVEYNSTKYMQQESMHSKAKSKVALQGDTMTKLEGICMYAHKEPTTSDSTEAIRKSSDVSSRDNGLQLQPFRGPGVRIRMNPFTKFFDQFSMETEQVSDPGEQSARRSHQNQLVNLCANGMNVNIVMKLHYEAMHQIDQGGRRMGDDISDLVLEYAMK